MAGRDAPEKPIVLSNHARTRAEERGATEEAVREAVRNGEREPAERGLFLYRMNREFHGEWEGHRYAVQQVIPIVDEEAERLFVVTVYVFYF